MEIQFIIFSCFILTLAANFCHSASLYDKSDIQDILNASSDMKFLIYTRQNPELYEQFELYDIEYLSFSSFDPKKPVKILTHGWKCWWGSAFNILIKNSFLIQYDANVIVVDWQSKASNWYPTARNYVPIVGKVVAYMIDEFNHHYGIKHSEMHIVGHSLGAHVAGVAGLMTSSKIGRITGLDPAGPLFSYKDDLRIRNDSANFVDIIHTAGHFTGFDYQLGHVDFYPNGGYPPQPGCTLDLLSLKSHRRAYWLFAESILTPQGFKAVSCSSWSDFKKDKCSQNSVAKMGEHVSNSTRGKYYLRTNYKSPFSLEQVI